MTEAALRGVDIAALVERYYKTGGRVLPGSEPYTREREKEPVSAEYLARIAELANITLPILGPADEAVSVEEWLEASQGEGLPVLRGRYDHFRLGVALPSRLSDVKSRSSFKYAKTEDELRNDTQLNAYAVPLMDGLGLERLEMAHVYTLTDKRRKPAGLEVLVSVTRDELEPRRLKTVESVRRMTEWARARPETADPLPPNTAACKKFPPHGCPYRGLCGFDGPTSSWASGLPTRSTTETEMGDGPSLMERMKATKEALAAKAAGGAPPKEQETKAPEEKRPALAAVYGFCSDCGTKVTADNGSKKDGKVTHIGCQGGEKESEPEKEEPVSVRAPDAPAPTNQPTDRDPDPKKERKKRETKAAAAPAEETTKDETPAAKRETVARCAPGSGPLTVPGNAKVLVLFIDCMPVKGPHVGAVDYSEWLAPIAAKAAAEAVNTKTGAPSPIPDWRLAEYGQGEGLLAMHIQAAIDTLPHAIVVTGTSKARAVFLEAVIPHAAFVIRGM